MVVRGAPPVLPIPSATAGCMFEDSRKVAQLVAVCSVCVVAGFGVQEDVVVYEMNVRAFTADPSSGLEPELRGSYQGVAEKVSSKWLAVRMRYLLFQCALLREGSMCCRS